MSHNSRGWMPAAHPGRHAAAAAACAIAMAGARQVSAQECLFTDANQHLWRLGELSGVQMASGRSPWTDTTYMFDICTNVNPSPPSCISQQVLGTVATERCQG